MDFFILWYLFHYISIALVFQGENSLSETLLKLINDTGQVYI